MAEEININEVKEEKQPSTAEAFMEVMTSGAASFDKSALDEFMAILELDDAKFDAVYPTMKDTIKQGFQDSVVRGDILEAMRRTPIIDLEAEEAGAREFIENIKQAEDLSENKKDFLSMIIELGVLATIEIYNNPRDKIKVQIEKIVPEAKLPEYAHPTDAGADVFAVRDTIVPAGKTVLVATGLRMAIPKGYEVQVRPRSGLSLKTDLRVANAPGTIDSSYRGELGIIMWNTGSDEITIEAGDKIAQLVIAPTPMMEFEEAVISTDTDRGEGGFGSTDA